MAIKKAKKAWEREFQDADEESSPKFREQDIILDIDDDQHYVTGWVFCHKQCCDLRREITPQKTFSDACHCYGPNGGIISRIITLDYHT